MTDTHARAVCSSSSSDNTQRELACHKPLCDPFRGHASVCCSQVLLWRTHATGPSPSQAAPSARTLPGALVAPLMRLTPHSWPLSDQHSRCVVTMSLQTRSAVEQSATDGTCAQGLSQQPMSRVPSMTCVRSWLVLLLVCVVRSPTSPMHLEAPLPSAR